MRMITAIIRPHKYEELRDALVAIGIEGITVSQVQGFGRQRGHAEIYRGAEYQVMEVPKVRIDVAVSAELVEKAVREIERAASTGKTGDGKIFVQPLEQVVRIRTGETNETALG
ncbi:P-II family nitrogen regulator [Parvibaculum sp.]|uniref:P-II family nitrogen regulator n=1 Tax=Parvibaculum sp. TaxID=2024848 RepID=UPI00329910F0